MITIVWWKFWWPSKHLVSLIFFLAQPLVSSPGLAHTHLLCIVGEMMKSLWFPSFVWFYRHRFLLIFMSKVQTDQIFIMLLVGHSCIDYIPFIFLLMIVILCTLLKPLLLLLLGPLCYWATVQNCCWSVFKWLRITLQLFPRYVLNLLCNKNPKQIHMFQKSIKKQGWHTPVDNQKTNRFWGKPAKKPAKSHRKAPP